METGEKLKSSNKNKSQTYESDFEKDAAIDTSGLKDIKDIRYDEETLLIANALLFFFAGFETIPPQGFQSFATSWLFFLICKRRFTMRLAMPLEIAKMLALNNFKK